jgi:cell fate regulator YaaT (PSP1 superfamily)
MGCGSCSSSGLPKGCKNNGSCGVHGCEKLTVFDWLSDMELAGQTTVFNVVEVRFKNGRKEYFKNKSDLRLYMGDVVAVEGTGGHDIGAVSLTGELVKLQLKNRNIKPEKAELKKIYRKASQRDIEQWKQAQAREKETMIQTRKIADNLGLQMKISDVEYQADNNKATFYYTAESRVDFRELIRKLASEFKVRIEMRQIGSRQEAAKIGGIGSCGRELCCSTWLTDFRSVNTSAARYQQLSLNPQKLAGQCGKLKCCLNYELDSYLDALDKFPDTQKNIETQKGEAIFQKMDIFKELLWYAYKEPGSDWVALPIKAVKELYQLNKAGKKPESLEPYDVSKNTTQQIDYENVVGQDDLTRFDARKGPKKKKRRAGKRRTNRQKNANSKNTNNQRGKS